MKRSIYVLVLWLCLLFNFNCTMSQKNIRSKMIEQLPAEQAHYKDLLSRPETTLEELETPFLKDHQLFRAKYFSRTKPVVFYIANGPKGFTSELTAKPDQFLEVVKRDGVNLNSSEKAAAYVRTYFEICRDQTRLSYIVESVEDIRFRPNLDEAGENAKRGILTTYSDQIGKMSVKQANGGYTTQFHIISDRELQLLSVELSQQGVLKFTAKLLAEELPTVYSK